jgi:hypothetical protein
MPGCWMPKRIPVSAAKNVAESNGCRQVILLAWDGELTHIVSYGKTVDDCAQAAAGANMLKEKWSWPECNDQPSRVKRLELAMQDLINCGEKLRVGTASGTHVLPNSDWKNGLSQTVTNWLEAVDVARQLQGGATPGRREMKESAQKIGEPSNIQTTNEV